MLIFLKVTMIPQEFFYFRTSVGIVIKFRGIPRNFGKRCLAEFCGISCTELHISVLSREINVS